MLAVKTIPHNLMVLKREVLLMGIKFEFSVVGNDSNWAEERINGAIIEIKVSEFSIPCKGYLDVILDNGYTN